MSDLIEGPIWAARNLSHSKGVDSIHNDATATDHGFRGGPVRADNHMNQFVPVILKSLVPSGLNEVIFHSISNPRLWNWSKFRCTQTRVKKTRVRSRHG